ncbi:MAG: PTS sugar transporter subunit IIA [candidate division Zixibacteria bacterium]|nr:PTS sugar transporter subunit IIA [candidate division Zixibacteria bacterium]
MNISRLLRTDLIKLRMETTAGSEEDAEDGVERTAKQKREDKEKVIEELVELLERSGKTGNHNKLLTDFINRERKATTAIGHGIAIPHIRSYQAKELLIGVALADPGYEFDAPDGELVRMFFVMAAPPYDDNLYLKLFKGLAELLRFDYFRERLLQASSEFDIIRAFEEME